MIKCCRYHYFDTYSRQENRMEKIKKMATNTGGFVRIHWNHIVIMGLFLFCIAYAIKMSKIPFLLNQVPFIERLFAKPQDGTIQLEVGTFINNIGMAYIASIVTYLVVQYIPERQKTKKAFLLFKSDFVSLYSYMSELIGMYLFEVNRADKKESEILISDLSEINGIGLTEEKKWGRKLDYRNGIRGNTVSDTYNLYKDAKLYSNLIIEKITAIKSSPSSKNIDEHLLEIISKIEGSRFLWTIRKTEEPYKKIPSYRLVILNQDRSFYEFIQCHIALERYKFDKITYRFVKLSPEEIEQSQKWNVLHTNRSIIGHFSTEEIEKRVNKIVGLDPEEETLNQAEGVLIELLVSYDSDVKKEKKILELSRDLAEYIYRNRTDAQGKEYAFLNQMQIKIRLNTPIKNKEISKLKSYEKKKDDKNMVLGSAILLKDEELAKSVFESMTEDEKSIFTDFPIYRLWENAPIPYDENPRLFIR